MSQSTSNQQYNKKLRCIIQFMISHGCVQDELFKTTATQILASVEEPREEDLYKLVHDANRRLNPYNIMIRTTMDDYTKEKYHVLISTVDNEITKAATRYHPKQVEFFKHLLQSIVHEPRGIIPLATMKECAEKAALPSSTKHSTTRRESEALLREWVNKKWFDYIEDKGRDYITLGVRSMAELDVFIKQKLIESATDLDCRNCGAMSIYSVLCSSCDARFHKRCAKTSMDEAEGLCRRCSSGHNVSTSRDAPTQNRESISTPSRRARRNSTSTQKSTPAQNSATKPQSKSTTKRRLRAKE